MRALLSVLLLLLVSSVIVLENGERKLVYGNSIAISIIIQILQFCIIMYTTRSHKKYYPGRSLFILHDAALQTMP